MHGVRSHLAEARLPRPEIIGSIASPWLKQFALCFTKDRLSVLIGQQLVANLEHRNMIFQLQQHVTTDAYLLCSVSDRSSTSDKIACMCPRLDMICSLKLPSLGLSAHSLLRRSEI